MTKQEIKIIRMGTILQLKTNGELFVVTGYNELKIKDGTATKVSVLECDEDGYSEESMPCLLNLENVEVFRYKYSIHDIVKPKKFK